MFRSSRRATTFAWMLILALVVPILAACGGTATTPAASPAPAASAPASEAPVASASPEASPTAEASPSAAASPSAEASPAGGTGEAAESPINDKVFVAAINQAPDTLFTAETNASASTQVTVAFGNCLDTLTYSYQPTYCFDELPTFENGLAVTETVQVDAATISAENPIVVDGTLVTDTTLAEEAGIEIPTELPQLRLTYNLNPDLKWEDGTPVTSDDVKFTLDILKNPEVQLSTRYTIERTVDVETPDPQTAVHVYAPGWLEAEYYTAFVGAAQINGSDLLPKHIYDGKSISEIRDAEGTQPISYGPYMLQDYVPGEQATLVSNPYFPQQPKIGTVIWRFVSDQEQLLAQLESGEIDYAGTIGLTLAQTEQLNDLEQAGTIKTAFVPATVWEHIDFGIERLDGETSYFSDPRVRQAVGFAINRQQIIDEVLFGRTVVMNTYVPNEHPSYPGDDKLEKYEFNPDRARELLQEAGFTQDRPITFYTTQGNATRQAVAEIIQQNLKEVGIEVELQFVPATEVLFRSGEEGILSGRRFDLGMYAWVSGTTPSHGLYRCDAIPTAENNYDGQNYPGYCNPEFDKATIAAGLELDDEKRRPLDAVPETIYNQDLPSFPLYQRVNVAAFDPSVTGIEIDPTSYFDLHNIQDIDIEQ